MLKKIVIGLLVLFLITISFVSCGTCNKEQAGGCNQSNLSNSDEDLELKQKNCKHNYIVLSKTTSSCISGSTITYKCSKCAKTYDSYNSALGNHAGVKNCSNCGKSFYDLLKSHLLSKGERSETGDYSVIINSSLDYFAMLVYDSVENSMYCSILKTTYSSEIFLSVDIEKNSTVYEWSTLYKIGKWGSTGGDWMFIGYDNGLVFGEIDISTYRGSDSLTSFSHDGKGSRFSAFESTKTMMEDLFGYFYNYINTQNLGFNTYNLGFISF